MPENLTEQWSCLATEKYVQKTFLIDIIALRAKHFEALTVADYESGPNQGFHDIGQPKLPEAPVHWGARITLNHTSQQRRHVNALNLNLSQAAGWMKFHGRLTP
jgi:hypothetical protein